MLTADMSFYRPLIRAIWHSLATTNQRGGTTVLDKITLGKNLLGSYYRRFFIHPECLHLQCFLSRHYLHWDWLRMPYNLLNENIEKNCISRVEWFWWLLYFLLKGIFYNYLKCFLSHHMLVWKYELIQPPMCVSLMAQRHRVFQNCEMSQKWRLADTSV